MDGVEEREVKLAVPDGFVMPSLAELAGATVADRGAALLHAVYWDTDELGLAGSGVGVRHRNGTWTYKGRSRRDGDAVVREELEVDGDAGVIPARISERLAQWIDVARVHPVAELRTVRRSLDVTVAAESAEVVHDVVSVRDGAEERARFEEVEVEYALASTPLADRIVALLARRGATVDSTSKYMRALRFLGHDPPEVSA